MFGCLNPRPFDPSFLAILCGENGEKVELFAGTYRTALGLSRTFILPDSPRSLELQLQGDDLVELFLMFNQNVFGLEPATVRVREVRIGRAERRARRRAAARENELLGGEGSGEGRDGMALDSDARDTQVITTVMSVGDDADETTAQTTPTPDPANGSTPRSSLQNRGPKPVTGTGNDASASPTAATTGGGSARSSTPTRTAQARNESSPPPDLNVLKTPAFPYTTFQQLSFAPNFPLAVIADEYVIPPTYLDFVGYQKQYEAGLDVTEIPTTTNMIGESASDAEGAQNGNGDELVVPPTPPGLPKPPARWVYRDPKGILRGEYPIPIQL